MGSTPGGGGLGGQGSVGQWPSSLVPVCLEDWEPCLLSGPGRGGRQEVRLQECDLQIGSHP